MNMSSIQKTNFIIKGIHCKSCKTLIETELSAEKGVQHIEVDYIKESAIVEFDKNNTSLEKIFEIISKLNYTPSKHNEPIKLTSTQKKNSNNSFWLGIGIPTFLATIIGGYYYISQSGSFSIMSKLNTDEASLGIIFLIGILAGFHCVGMCGGFVVSYTTKNALNKKNNTKQHLHYNLGRLISYTTIGAILGTAGSFFGINPNFSGTMLLIAGALMFVMGMAFFTGYPLFNAIKLKTPQLIAKFLYSQKHQDKPKGPLIIGLLNGFMPCGPLQAMQLYALSTGSLTQGALAMAAYAAGTIPIMFGFGAFISKLSQNSIHKVIKLSGILIVLLGLVMFNRGLINFNLGLNFNTIKSSKTQQNQPTTQKPTSIQKVQEIEMTLGYYGYEPSTLHIKRGIPVRWKINVTAMSGCTNSIMIESLGIKKNLQKGMNIIEFTPPNNVNQIDFSCWMKMVWGKFIVTD